MWWTGQNLARPVRSPDGRLWHFRVWHGHSDGVYRQRIFFWDESRADTGCAEFARDQALHVSRIRQRIRKLVTDAAYRARYRRELEFPVERHYS
jgi:hypothetical protein